MIPDDSGKCHDFSAQFPQSLIEPDPATLTVSLVVPTEALRPLNRMSRGIKPAASRPCSTMT